jgi:ssDNA-binding replication factor A large subunit
LIYGVALAVKIRDVIASHARNVEVVGRIVKKELVLRPNIRLAKVTLEDETGAIILNLWRNQVDQCQVGDKIKVHEAFVRSYRGAQELNTWEDIEVLEP